MAKYAELFPDRPDKLTLRDVHNFSWSREMYRELFSHYDVVQCYATQPIAALLAGKKPYVSFEHGTLRHFTLGDKPLHRLTALAYRMSDHTFITNGDCLAYAKRLGLESYSPIIHPIDVDQHRKDYGTAIDGHQTRDWRRCHSVLSDAARLGHEGYSTVHPGVAVHQAAGCRPIRLLLVDWGLQVDESKKLLDELGCAADDVVWKTSMCRITMIKHIRAADAVFDQMVLPVFGSTAPQAISAGTPVIGSYVPEETSWLIPEPAPIVSAFTPQEVAEAVVQALDPNWLRDYQRRASLWTDTYHHPDVVVREHLRVYRRILGGMPPRDGRREAPG